jgi:hypothetical protein
MDSRINYWMHVVTPARGEGTYLLAVSNTRGGGGAMPTVVYPSWEELSIRLGDCGVTKTALVEAKTELDSQGICDIREIELTRDQLTYLGIPRADAAVGGC